jgi:hypothetical protein
MKRWAQRTRNLIVLGVLLASAIGVASVITAPWVEESVPDISRPVETPSIVQEQRDAGKKKVMSPDSIPGSAAETVKTRVEKRERWVDVF